MRARATVAVSALRSALAAVDNAEAVAALRVPPSNGSPIAGSVAGLGAGEVPRRQLGEHEVADIPRAEQSEWDQRLRREADVLAGYLRQHR